MELELERLKKQINLFKKAYKTLRNWFKQENFNDLEKDWIIQRFEYTIELSWKTCKKFLEYEKLDFIQAPRDILKESFKIGLIDDLKLWSDFLDIRNSMSHMYSEYVSGDSFIYIQKKYKKIWKLIKKLNSSLEK